MIAAIEGNTCRKGDCTSGNILLQNDGVTRFCSFQCFFQCVVGLIANLGCRIKCFFFAGRNIGYNGIRVILRSSFGFLYACIVAVWCIWICTWSFP